MLLLTQELGSIIRKKTIYGVVLVAAAAGIVFLFLPSPVDVDVAPYLDLLPDEPFFAYVGDFRATKGYTVLLDAYEAMRTDRPLVLVGKRVAIIGAAAAYTIAAADDFTAMQIAGETEGYTLVDRGTWLAYQANSPLELLVSGGTGLKNPYGIIAVDAKRFPDINHEGAGRLIEWFQSDRARELIAGYRVNGEQLFYPVGS